MTYPTIGDRKSNEIADLLRVGGLPEGQEEGVVLASEGGGHDAIRVGQVAAAARQRWETRVSGKGEVVKEQDLYDLETEMAVELHRLLADLPVAMLADMGYWRYLALFPFRWYLLAREPELQPQDFGGIKVEIDVVTGRERYTTPNSKYQLILRSFLWGKAAYDASAPVSEGPPPEPANDPRYTRAFLVGVTGGAVIDVWHSHIVRVQLGQLGGMPGHFIDSICAEPKANDRDKGRAVEKRLTRMKHNVLLDVYEADGRALVDEQKAAALGDFNG